MPLLLADHMLMLSRDKRSDHEYLLQHKYQKRSFHITKYIYITKINVEHFF